ncbi:RND family efflux transporter, MFP subunit [Microbulbifer donghaiensis]|uniref:RND family efflux transporter, MFP subunit n=1 Tax=Microbulbifer donghaiensis TaxID=494016 RepID=A0A1M4UH83_9GAMM|nr:efflux RND transporter periplasmic adaptor subunit [Microbulbifer donghaiensis]SHE56035.1 RND family efflux transporter, MFP subunit [Microbulbifer donghaiensis]
MIYRFLLIALVATLAACRQAEQADHPPLEAHNQSAGASESGTIGRDRIVLNDAQMATAEIRVEPLRAQIINYRYYAPGEVVANGYRSYLLSPRVDSVVVERHAVLGQHVQKGQPLVTLTSEAIATAQEALHSSADEWRRVEKLGREFVGEKRFVLAQSRYRSARGKLQALGLTDSAIAGAAEGKLQAAGEYTLTAAIGGVVLADNFHQGQAVSAGDSLLQVASENELWVEARLPADNTLPLPAESPAFVAAADSEFPARVAQEAHAIDRETRTRVVRLTVDNQAHRLHPGMFADVYFQLNTRQPVIAVPESALLRGDDGDWILFVETEPNRFQATEVEVGATLGDWRLVSGVAEGTRVVMQGAFFVAAQISKGGFDPHNH